MLNHRCAVSTLWSPVNTRGAADAQGVCQGTGRATQEQPNTAGRSARHVRGAAQRAEPIYSVLCSSAVTASRRWALLHEAGNACLLAARA